MKTKPDFVIKNSKTGTFFVAANEWTNKVEDARGFGDGMAARVTRDILEEEVENYLSLTVHLRSSTKKYTI